MGIHAQFALTLPGSVADDNFNDSSNANQAFAHDASDQQTQDHKISGWEELTRYFRSGLGAVIRSALAEGRLPPASVIRLGLGEWPLCGRSCRWAIGGEP